METIVVGIVSFVILSMWCGVMDTLYDIRRDVRDIKDILHDDTRSSESVHGQHNLHNNESSYESKNM